MATQPTHHFLTLLPSNHATFSAATVAPDTIPDTTDSPTSFLTNDIQVQPKTRRSSSLTTASSATTEGKAVGAAEPIVAAKRTSTFLSNWTRTSCPNL
jgi:hypothetical protein